MYVISIVGGSKEREVCIKVSSVLVSFPSSASFNVDKVMWQEVTGGATYYHHYYILLLLLLYETFILYKLNYIFVVLKRLLPSNENHSFNIAIVKVFAGKMQIMTRVIVWEWGWCWWLVLTTGSDQWPVTMVITGPTHSTNTSISQHLSVSTPCIYII